MCVCVSVFCVSVVCSVKQAQAAKQRPKSTTVIAVRAAPEVGSLEAAGRYIKVIWNMKCRCDMKFSNSSHLAQFAMCMCYVADI